jgi:hypothetical protein
MCLYKNLVKNARFEDKFSNEIRIMACGRADPISSKRCFNDGVAQINICSYLGCNVL